MRHPDFARLAAFEDGQTAGPARERTARHLASCARCRTELASIRALRTRAATATVLPVPEDALERILARRAAGERIIPPAAVGRAPAGIHPRILRRAAVLLLGVAGIASAAVAAPRLRAWLAAEGEAASPAPSTSTDSARSGAAPAAAEATSGVGIFPESGRARVDVDGADPALRIRVRLVGGDELEARATGAAAGAVFHPRPGRLRVQNAGPGELELLLPRGAARVEVRVDGEPYLLKDGPQLRVLRAGADTAGSEVLLRVGGAAP